eukprot:7089290-Prymnesium_polylepis.1
MFDADARSLFHLPPRTRPDPQVTEATCDKRKREQSRKCAPFRSSLGRPRHSPHAEHAPQRWLKQPTLHHARTRAQPLRLPRSAAAGVRGGGSSSLASVGGASRSRSSSSRAASKLSSNCSTCAA